MPPPVCVCDWEWRTEGHSACLSSCLALGCGHRVPAEVQACLEGSGWAEGPTAQNHCWFCALGEVPQSLCAGSCPHFSPLTFPSFLCHCCATSQTTDSSQACPVGVQWPEHAFGCVCLPCPPLSLAPSTSLAWVPGMHRAK